MILSLWIHLMEIKMDMFQQIMWDNSQKYSQRLKQIDCEMQLQLKSSLVSFYFGIPLSGFQKCQKRFIGISGLCDRRLGNAPLAAGTFDHVGGGVALTGLVLWIISALRGLQIECGAAEQILL